MPELPDVTEKFEANVVQFIAAMDEIIAKATEVVDSIHDIITATDSMALLVEEAAGATAGSLEKITAQAGIAAGALGKVASQAGDIRTAMAGAAAASTAAAATMGAAAAATDAGMAGATARTIGWFRLTGNAIHWLVMGTLEIASTAIPALVAFGAAIFAMTPAFTFAKDQMTNLVIASGSLTKALQNSPGPLHALAAGLSDVQAHATPDAFIILGSAISVLTTHTGVFAKMASQASDVLANFATKIVADLAPGSPGAAALTGFFDNAVKYMIQWGQFLGNLGHAFLNTVHAMWGVGQVLLDVLVKLSQAFLALTNNRVGAWLIGIAAAMSALYRYGLLAVKIFEWFGGSLLVTGIKNLAGWAVGIVAIGQDLGVTAAAAQAAGDIMDIALGPVGIAIAAITAGLSLWYLATRHTADATDNLIKRVQAMPPTVQNLSGGIDTLSKALAGATQHQAALNRETAILGAHGWAAEDQAAGDVKKLTAAITQQEQKLVELRMGLAQLGSTTGQVGHDMLALSIATDLQDSKVTQLNQAWDSYIGMVTGGTSALGGMTESLLNLGKVTVTSANALKGYNATVGLTTSQAAAQMKNFGAIGSQVWQNFNNVLTGSMQPLADWLRTAQTAGAITGPQFSKAVLDMASSLVGFAKDSKPAQAELVAFAQQAGLNIKTFPQLEQAIKSTGASAKDLTGVVTNATIAEGNLNQIAKNLSATLSTQETQAIASAALAATHFSSDLNNMLKAQQDNGSYGGRTTAQWAALVNRDMNNASSSADHATRSIHNVAAAEGGLYSKNITIGVNTVYTTSGSPGAGGYTTGTGGNYGRGGASGGYVTGPGTSTSDSVHAMLSHGEYVVNAAAVEHYGRAAMDAMNARRLAGGGPAITPGRPSPAVSAAALGSGGGGQITIHLQNDTYLDKSKVLSSLRTEQLEYFRRNPSGNLDLRNR